MLHRLILGRLAFFALLHALILVPGAQSQRLMENLGRGLVAMPTEGGDVFLSWRLLGYEPENLSFNVYRSSGGGAAAKINAAPLAGGTNYLDTDVDLSIGNSYYVRPELNGVELTASESFELEANPSTDPYLSLPLEEAGNRYVHLVWVGDLNGDGEFDYIVSRMPSSGGMSQYLDAYLNDGTFLWRVDFGPLSVDANNIEPVAAAINAGHNDGVTVYDLDSDGRSEVIIKSADGVIFGDGQTLNHSDDVGQFVSVLDGMSGSEIARAPVPDDYIADGPVAGHFGIAYLDGVNPSFVFKAKNRIGSGAFNLMVVTYDFDGTNLTERWKFAPGPDFGEYPNFHQIRIVDVDQDGFDEVCDGGYVLDEDGSVLYTLSDQGVVHGDRFHIGDLDPDRPGLEGFGIQQDNGSGLLYYVYDAADGTMIHTHFGEVADTARGTAADIDADYRGYEYWSFWGIHEIETGDTISFEPNRPWPNFRIWWDGDVMSENLNREIVEKWDPNTQSTNQYINAGNYGAVDSWRDAAQFYGDIFGDWREEVVYEKSDGSELMIFTTMIPSDTRLYTLPHNPEYRLGFTVKGYLQSLMLDYYLGDGMAQPPAPDILPAVPSDATVPAILAMADDAGFSDKDRITNDTTPTLFGVAPAGSTVVISRAGFGDDGSIVVAADGTWSFEYTTPLADGEHYFLARVDGSTDEFSYPFFLSIDSVAADAPSIGAVVANPDGGYALHGNGVPGTRVDVSLDGVGLVGSAFVDESGSWTVSVETPLASGQYTFSAEAVDLAGNVSDSDEQFVDTSNPRPAIESIADDTGVSASDQITSDQTLVLSGTAEPGDIVEVFRLGGGSVGSATADGSGFWILDYSGTTLSDGVYTFTAYVGDSLGSEPIEVTIDTMPAEVLAIVQTAPEENESSVLEVTFQVGYVGPVTGVDAADFSLSLGGDLTGQVASVSEVDAATYDVVVELFSGAGTVSLVQNATGTGIEDLAGNELADGFEGPVFTRVLLGDGVWTNPTSGGPWDTNTNWQNGIIAEGVNSVADFSTIDITSDNAVTLDSDHTLGSLSFGDTDPSSSASWTVTGDGSHSLTLELEGATPTVSVDGLGEGASATLDVPLEGTGGLAKQGDSPLILSAANSLDGRVYVDQGSLQLGDGGMLMPERLYVSGSGNTFVLDGGEFASSGRIELNSAGRFIVNAGSANLDWIRGRNSSGIAVHVNGGSLQVNTISFERSTASSLDYNTGFVVRGGEARVEFDLNLGTSNSNGMMSVEGGLASIGGNVVLGNQSTGGRGGHMRVIGGELQIENSLVVGRRDANATSARFEGGVSVIENLIVGFDGSVGSGSGLVSLEGGSLYLGSGGISSNGSGGFVAEFNLGSGMLGAGDNWSTDLPASLLDDSDFVFHTENPDGEAKTIEINSVLSGDGGFIKTGGGTLVLAGDNTFTGPVSVEYGQLVVDGSIAAGEPIVLNGGILRGDGAIDRSVVLNTATIQPGMNEGFLTGDSLTWNSGGTLAIGLGDSGESDLLNYSGALLKGDDGVFAVAFSALGDSIQAGTYTVATFGSTDFEASDFTAIGIPDSLEATFSVSDSSIQVSLQESSVEVELSDLLQTYDGLAKSPTVNTVPEGLPVSLTFDGSPEAPIFPGTYEVVASVDGAGDSATAEFTIVITAHTQQTPQINGTLDGSIQVNEPASFALNGGSEILGDLLVPGTPEVRVNGSATLVDVVDGLGSDEPTDHVITLNGGSMLRYLIRKVDALEMPTVDAPLAPTGTQHVYLNNSSDTVDDWSEVRSLTLNGNVGSVEVPAGAYEGLTANGNNELVLGVEGASEPAAYDLQQLHLNGNSKLRVVGPVIVTLANSVNMNGRVLGEAWHPEWLSLRFAQGGLTLNGNATAFAFVTAPNGSVSVNGGSTLVGQVVADAIVINGNGQLIDPSMAGSGQATGDLNGDESVDNSDLLVLRQLLANRAYAPEGDLNGDGSVDFLDYRALAMAIR